MVCNFMPCNCLIVKHYSLSFVLQSPKRDLLFGKPQMDNQVISVTLVWFCEEETESKVPGTFHIELVPLVSGLGETMGCKPSTPWFLLANSLSSP